MECKIFMDNYKVYPKGKIVKRRNKLYRDPLYKR